MAIAAHSLRISGIAIRPILPLASGVVSKDMVVTVHSLHMQHMNMVMAKVASGVV
jgi:hypothetical protein